MVASKIYLVPVDFSKGSEIALKHAITLARENKAKLFVLHVISTAFEFPLKLGFAEIFEAFEKNAHAEMDKVIRRFRLNPGKYRSIFVHGKDIALAIAAVARKSRASMIIMGSHGRTGLQRFMLGSIAKRTLHYAQCPVLIVKK